MPKIDQYRKVLRHKYILLIIWIISFLILILSYIFALLYPGQIPKTIQIPLLCIVNLASGFFFPLTVSRIIEFIRDRDIATVIWDFSSECRDAGLLMFYSSRDNEIAKRALEKSFLEHNEGDILIVGPSLRLFFASDAYFRKEIENNLDKYEEKGVKIRAIYSHIDKNRSLPIRSYIEEFNPDGTHPEGKPRKKFIWQSINFNNWNGNCSKDKFSLDDFCRTYHEKFSKNFDNKYVRCIQDLKSVEIGLNELNSRTDGGKVIEARTTICAPYCTAIIFPNVCYFTPNLLYHSAPVNLPMLSFLRGGSVYDRILDHFKFLWWTGLPLNAENPDKES